MSSFCPAIFLNSVLFPSFSSILHLPFFFSAFSPLSGTTQGDYTHREEHILFLILTQAPLCFQSLPSEASLLTRFVLAGKPGLLLMYLSQAPFLLDVSLIVNLSECLQVSVHACTYQRLLANAPFGAWEISSPTLPSILATNRHGCVCLYNPGAPPTPLQNKYISNSRSFEE